MSSFLGSRVAVQLQQGGQVTGTISAIDGMTGSLTVQQEHNRSLVTITRPEIADLQILPAAAPQAASTSVAAPPPAPPAVISYASQAALGLPSSPRQKAPPTGPAAMQASLSDRGAAAAARKSAAGKAVKAPRTRTPDVGGNTKGKHGARALANGDSDLEEDFDFDKALRGFDKKKVWEEIKTSDKSDPRMLLVSHNRVADAEANGFVIKGKRSGQEKLAWDEPVLSPSPPPSGAQQRAVAVAEPTLGMQDVSTELNRVRGNALQRDIELSKLRDEVQTLKAKVSLLESLSGAEVEAAAQAADGTSRWIVTLYDSVASHAEGRREAVKFGSQRASWGGALSFTIGSGPATGGKLRYSGPVAGKSDAAVVERLPLQYRGEMGLKPETASLFLRRIKDAIQPPSS